MSSTGQYQIAGVTSAFPQISNNYGVTWTRVLNGYYTGCDISANGQFISVSLRFGSGAVEFSSNYGTTWNVGILGGQGLGVNMSRSGQYQYINAGSSTRYRSTNYGVTWTSMAFGTPSIRKVSQSGKFVWATDDSQTPDNVYRSTDFGLTFPDAGLPFPAVGAYVVPAIRA
jgi:hypothetical protein